MAGDSVLAVFELATAAATAALTIQQEPNAGSDGVPNDRRMCFRIGVHLGEIIEKADGTVYGDGVNMAARLQGLAEPGGVTVSDSVRNAVRGKVGATFHDQGEQAVKNIADPVRAFKVKPDGGGPAKPTSAAIEIDLSLPDKPSIAVLPFTNLSGDPEQEYFADGLAEDIITGLSRFHWFFVIARNSSFTYKHTAVDVKQVARDLGVQYVLEGSVRKAGNRVRITGQLIDALTGRHVWAERYDRLLEDIFVVQNELTEAIVGAVAPSFISAEARRLEARTCACRAHPADPPRGDDLERQLDRFVAVAPHALCGRELADEPIALELGDLRRFWPPSMTRPLLRTRWMAETMVSGPPDAQSGAGDSSLGANGIQYRRMHHPATADAPGFAEHAGAPAES
jgi:adenylate cyclase